MSDYGICSPYTNQVAGLHQPCSPTQRFHQGSVQPFLTRSPLLFSESISARLSSSPSHSANHTSIFFSCSYARKNWTHELRSTDVTRGIFRNNGNVMMEEVVGGSHSEFLPQSLLCCHFLVTSVCSATTKTVRNLITLIRPG